MFLYVYIIMNLLSVFLSFQCANAVEPISRQMELLEEEIQVGLLRQAAHSLSGSYEAVPSQGKGQFMVSMPKGLYVI